MKGLGLVSNYTVAQYKIHKSTCNEAPVKNELQRQFSVDIPIFMNYKNVIASF